MVQPVQRPVTTPAPLPARPKRMRLDAITSGRFEKPKRIMLVGTEGIGKSTFGAGAPAPVFLGAEDGTSELDVSRLPNPHDWEDMLDGVALLHNETHAYRTLVVDTVDWAEPLLWSHVCKKNKKDSIEDFGFGKGYTAALDEWRVFLARLDALQAKTRMDVIMLAHSWIKTFKNPEGEDYDRYELKLNNKAAGLLKEWCDAVLFAHYETFAVTKEKRTRGVSSGARLIHTTRTAAWDAKNRYGLPDALPLSWDEFDAAVKAGAPASPVQLHAEIAGLLEQVDEKARATVGAWLTAAPRSASELAQMADKLRGKINISNQQQQTDTTKEESNQ